MKTLKGPGVFLAQFATDGAPFDTLDGWLAGWAAAKGFKGVQIPAWDTRLIDLQASQVALGCSNGLRLRVFGEKGGLFWYQEAPNELMFAPLNEQSRTIKRGADYLSVATLAHMRTPLGHPEGYLEAFSNLYAGFAETIRSRAEGRSPEPIGQNLPTLHDGVKGVAFVDAVVDCHEKDLPAWVRPAVI